jgi:hypothetical protein
LGLYLISRQADVNRRLLLCGYQAWELVLARLLVLGCAIVAVSIFSGVLLQLCFAPRHLSTTILGLVLVGFVYGCYGLLAGSIFKRELEGVLSIVLLANIDVAWLQNPIFYTESKNKAVIRWLPAHFPAQTGMIGAFSDHSAARAVWVSLGYGSLLLGLAVLVFWARMRVVAAPEARAQRTR